MAFDGSKEAIERTRRGQARISNASVKTSARSWAAQQLAVRAEYEHNYVAPQRKKTPAQLEAEFYQLLEQMNADDLARRL